MKRILAFILLPFLAACVQDPMEEIAPDVRPEVTPEVSCGESLVFDAHILSFPNLVILHSGKSLIMKWMIWNLGIWLVLPNKIWMKVTCASSEFRS